MLISVGSTHFQEFILSRTTNGCWHLQRNTSTSTKKRSLPVRTQSARPNLHCSTLFMTNQEDALFDTIKLMQLLNLKPTHFRDLTHRGGDDPPTEGQATDDVQDHMTVDALLRAGPLALRDTVREVRGEKGYLENDTIAHHHRLAPLVVPTNSFRVVFNARLNTSQRLLAINGLQQENAATETLANFFIRLTGILQREPMTHRDKQPTLLLKFKHPRLMRKRPFSRNSISQEVILTHATTS